MPTPTKELLRGVWGTSPTDIFAVGEAGVILRFDGIRWYAMESPTQKALRGVIGTGPTDVFAVGEDGLLLHFDGAQWTEVTSPSNRLLIQAWGAPGATALYAVGAVTTVLRGSR
jgi:hypothetical protein